MLAGIVSPILQTTSKTEILIRYSIRAGGREERPLVREKKAVSAVFAWFAGHRAHMPPLVK